MNEVKLQQTYEKWKEESKHLNDELRKVDSRYCHYSDVERRYMKGQLRLQLAGMNASYRSQIDEAADEIRDSIRAQLEPTKPRLSFGEIKTIIENL